jgi:hypothetical protein
MSGRYAGDNPTVSDFWGGLLILGFGLVFALGGWFASVWHDSSTIEMFTGQRPQPGSARHAMLPVNRWIFTIVGLFFAVCGLSLVIQALIG